MRHGEKYLGVNLLRVTIVLTFDIDANKKYGADYFIDNIGHTSYQTLRQFVTADEAKEACESSCKNGEKQLKESTGNVEIIVLNTVLESIMQCILVEVVGLI